MPFTTETATALCEAAAEHLLALGAVGVAGLVEIPDGPMVRVACGAADLQSGAPLTGRERFFAGSQTKMLTAAAILRLVRSGDLTLDTSIGGLWPGADALGLPETATVRQLLTHTAGIGNFSDFVQGMAPPNYPTVIPTGLRDEDLIRLARIRGAQFAPGAGWAYNNTGYVVLGQIVERLTGLPAPAFIERELLRPLGLNDTSFARNGWSREGLCAGYFEPAGRRGAQLSVPDALADLSIASSAGDMISTLDDMRRWLRATAAGTLTGGPTLADFLADVVDVWPSVPDWTIAPAYALGVERVTLGGRAMWGHMGATVGYRSGSFLCPDSGLLVGMFMTFVHRPDPMAHLGLQAKRQEFMSILASVGASFLA